MINFNKFVKKRKIVLASLSALFAAVALPPQGHAERRWPGLQPESYLVIGQDGVEYAAERADESVVPASTAKLMTLYMTMEAIRDGKLTLNSKIEMSPKATKIKAGYRRLGLKAGEHFTVSRALESMFVYSANDIASATGAHIAKIRTGDWSEDQFVKLMNKKAAELGMQDTRFKDASGMNDSARTTARDMAVLVAAMVRDFPELYDGNALFPDYPTQANVKVGKATKRNTNLLLEDKENLRFQVASFDRAIDFTVEGWKTGFTAKAGFCTVVSASAIDPRNGENFRVIVSYFGSGQSGELRDAKVAVLLKDAFEERFSQPLDVIMMTSLPTTNTGLPLDPHGQQSGGAAGPDKGPDTSMGFDAPEGYGVLRRSPTPF